MKRIKIPIFQYNVLCLNKIQRNDHFFLQHKSIRLFRLSMKMISTRQIQHIWKGWLTLTSIKINKFNWVRVDRYYFDLKLSARISKCHRSLDSAFSVNTNNPIRMDKNGISHTHKLKVSSAHTITFSWIASGCLMRFHIVKTNKCGSFLVYRPRNHDVCSTYRPKLQRYGIWDWGWTILAVWYWNFQVRPPFNLLIFRAPTRKHTNKVWMAYRCFTLWKWLSSSYSIQGKWNISYHPIRFDDRLKNKQEKEKTQTTKNETINDQR